MRLLLVVIGVGCFAVSASLIVSGHDEILQAIGAVVPTVLAVFSVREDLRELWRGGGAPPPGVGVLGRTVRRLRAGLTSTVRWQDLGRVVGVIGVVAFAVWQSGDEAGARCTGPVVRDVSPPAGATVRPRKTFTGTTACLADDEVAYIVVVPDLFPGYYPQGEAIRGNRHWSRSVTFGGPPGQTYNVFVVIPDDADRQAIEDYLENDEAVDGLSGSDIIYEGTYS